MISLIYYGTHQDLDLLPPFPLYVDSPGYVCDLLLAGWLDRDTYRVWLTQTVVSAWWTRLPHDPTSDVGYWREV
jgi:hypothetical protein